MNSYNKSYIFSKFAYRNNKWSGPCAHGLEVDFGTICGPTSGALCRTSDVKISEHNRPSTRSADILQTSRVTFSLIFESCRPSWE